MNLFSIVFLCFFALVAYQFWRLRSIAEQIRGYLQRYCQQNQLQLLSLARKRSRIRLHKGKPDWQCEFVFEFSGNGQDSYQGHLHCTGLSISQLDLPAYKIN